MRYRLLQWNPSHPAVRYPDLRWGYEDLDELKTFAPFYEGQGMFVYIIDSRGNEHYSTPVE